jgi:flagellar export protein FliJ
MARRFFFRLHALLRLREAMETEARRHLARMLRAQLQIETQLDDLRHERAATFESRRSAPGEPVDLLRWRLAERYLVVLERREARLQAALREAINNSENARSSLVKARQERLTMLRLKERRQAIHDRENDRKERLEVDDLAVIRSRFVKASQHSEVRT